MQLRLFHFVTIAALSVLLLPSASLAQQNKFQQPGNPPGNEAAFPPPDVQGNYNPNQQGSFRPQMGQGGMQGQAGQGMMPPQGQGTGMMQGQGTGMMPGGMAGQGMRGHPGGMNSGPANSQAYFGNGNGNMAAPMKKVNPQQAAKVFQWFLNYDEIRRRAQMNPIEKQRADGLLARGFGLFMPGQDKLAAKQLLSELVQKYQSAAQSLQTLAPLEETKPLQEAYFQYFDSAMLLFSDYLKVQDNVFAVDNTGQSIAKQLIQRKLSLESLEHNCKELDFRTRQAFGVAPYQY